MRQWSIGSGPAATLLVAGDPDNPVPVLIQNVDPNNTAYLGETSAVNSANPLENVPLLPGQSSMATGNIDVYAIASPGQNVAIYTLRGFDNFFQQTIVNGTTIVAGTFLGLDFEINSNGAFFYSGPPALGNLVATIANSNGIDHKGNAYLAQVTGYGFNAGVGIYVAGQVGTAVGEGAGLNLYTATSPAGPWSLQATCSTDTSGIWSFNANSYKFLASGNLFAQPSQHVIAADTAIQQRQTSSWQGNMPSVQANAQQIAVSAAAFQNLTAIYTIPAKDGNINTVYRLTCGGFMAFGATVQVLTVQLVFASFAIVIPMGGAEFLPNTTYGWRAQGEYIVASGAQNAAQLVGSLSFDIGAGGANLATVAGTAQTAGGFAQQTTTSVIDLTVARAMAFQAKYAAASAGNAITCNYSYLERLGA